MVGFIAFSITLLSSAFSIGGVSNLFIRYRTRLLRLMVLFLISLFSIALGFWTDSDIFRMAGIFGTGTETLVWIFQLVGGGLNIAVTPLLVSALIGVPISQPVKTLLWCWSGAFILIAGVTLLSPGLSWLLYILTFQQLATILGSLLFMAMGIPDEA